MSTGFEYPLPDPNQQFYPLQAPTRYNYPPPPVVSNIAPFSRKYYNPPPNPLNDSSNLLAANRYYNNYYIPYQNFGQYYVPGELYYNDVENQQPQDSNVYQANYKLSDLSESARYGFVQKVYTIFSTMLLGTAFACYLAINNYQVSYFMFRNPGLLYVCMIASIMMICCIGCNKQLARSVPTNYILLGIFTFMQSYMVAAVCASIQSPLIVYEAFAITGGIFIAMTIYAILSKEDFTLCGGMLLGAFMALIISGLFLGFSNSSAVQLVYASIAALVFCFSILQSTQLIVGYKAYKYSIDDYVLATMDIYIDFIGLFLRVLQILAYAQSNYN